MDKKNLSQTKTPTIMEKMDIFNIKKHIGASHSDEHMGLVQHTKSKGFQGQDVPLTSASEPSIFSRLVKAKTTVSEISLVSTIVTGTVSPTQSIMSTRRHDIGVNYADDYISCFKPFAPYSIFLGRLPFTYSKDPRTGIYKIHQTKTLANAYYGTSILILILSLIYWVNGLSYLLDFPRLVGPGVASDEPLSGRSEESFLFYRNAPILFIYGMALMHLNVSSLQTIVHAKFISSYFGFAANSLNLIKLPACKGLPTKVFYITLTFTILLLCLIILTCTRLSPIGYGGPGLLGMLLVRIFNQRLFIDPEHQGVYDGLRWFMSIVFLYILMSSKVYPMLFIIQNKMIRSLFHLWNQRLEVVLNRKPTRLSMEYSERTSFHELYDDHNLIIQLLRGADVLFQESIDSYFFSMVFGTSSDLYFFWRSASGYEYDESRQGDLLAAVTLLVINLIFFVLCLVSMMKLAEESMEGLDAVRRRNFMGRKTEEELYFLYSLYVSYSGSTPMVVVASGYCVYDNNFVFAVLGNIAVFSVIMYQVSVPIALPENHESYLYVVDQEVLLEKLEGGPPRGARSSMITEYQF